MITLPAAGNTLANLTVTGGYLVFAIAAVEFPQGPLRYGAMLAVIALAAIAWVLSYRRYHTIVDTPTARIQSAAQGYVELHGRSALLPGAPPLGFANSPPCVWYRYRVLRDGKLIDSGQSHDTFLLTDATGECVIDPDLAEIVTQHRRTITRDNYVTVLEYLPPGGDLYAIGHFHTLGGTQLTLERDRDTRELLGEWKRDPAQLLARFDLNLDGEISLTEWQAARKAALEEISQRHAEMRLRPDTHIMSAPPDGRPYLLSSRDPDSLAAVYRYWSWLHAGIFVLGFALIPIIALAR